MNLDNEKKGDMDDLLDRFFEELKACLKHKFPRYIIKVSQLNGSFFFLSEDIYKYTVLTEIYW